MQFLPFEQPIADLQAKIDSLRKIEHREVNFSDELLKLEAKCQKLTEAIFKKLTDWQIIQLARHPDRPYTLDYLPLVFTEFDELHGDRNFGDDPAIIGGTARLNGLPVMVIGQQKGRTTKEKLYRNFGMPHPEGYRKALRLMKLAEQFNLPVITLIDTPGAYPGVNAEARGQSEAIARNLREMSVLEVPIICVVIGEGCSGGALGIGVGDKTLMMQYSYYATISPEGCASILWKEASKAEDAAEIMGITANKLGKTSLIDEVISEPFGGAHRDIPAAAELLKSAIQAHLEALIKLPKETLLKQRYERLTSFGEFQKVK
jgi:acetyl-CoA carboxylase carboxyl transferase subunit alpha